MASLTNSATIAADAIPAPKLVGCIDEANAATSNIVPRGCEAADHACFGLTLLDVPKSVTCSSAADNSGCREQSDGSSSFGRQQFTTEESARTADESDVLSLIFGGRKTMFSVNCGTVCYTKIALNC
ncbi:hypothetical protein [Rhizobium leguminosarum]|uniref:hypothetical protein n=1 Tax=Rhizobium leguminosarum TaxID=384 RepID=UPI003F9766B2